MKLSRLVRSSKRRLLRLIAPYRKGNYDRDLLRAGSEVLLEGETFIVNWSVTRKCNYACSYCTVYDNVHGVFPPLDHMKRAVDFIAGIDQRHILVTFSGGEPTVYPHYIELVSYLRSRMGERCTIQTITNLSRTPKYYRELSAEFADMKPRIQFKASFHFDFASVDRFIANVETLVDEGMRVRVSLMAHPEKMKQVRELHGRLDELCGELMSFSVPVIREGFGSVPDKRYSEADLDWLRGRYEAKNNKSLVMERWNEAEGRIEQERYTPGEMIVRGLNRFRGMWCEAGVSMISIDQNGNVTPAVCFRGCPGKKVNIYTGNLADLAQVFHPIICPFDRCGCLADLQLPKYVDGAPPRPVDDGLSGKEMGAVRTNTEGQGDR